MELHEYWMAVGRYYQDYKHVRKGQAAFNVLDQERHDLAILIAGIDGLDPFFEDENLSRFANYIAARWQPSE